MIPQDASSQSNFKMKTSTVLVAMLASLPLAFAQSTDLAPSPTESIGCEPHGDHWHCDGPRETVGGPVETSPAAEDDHDHDHDDDDHAAGSGSLAPSPTQSVGCEPHGDHWHCDGPRTEAEEHAAGTGSLAPSPTQSVGCEPHGDHWHCDGPRTTPAPGTTPGSNANNDDDDADDADDVTTTTQPGAAATAHALPLAGLLAAAVLAL
ncbi:hypothetical protein HJFPF1_09935 [Paramyrothecium foliicola]|nr:hypothetical protein HJFPF1_09935 [Paramyrothecium foliicola]